MNENQNALSLKNTIDAIIDLSGTINNSSSYENMKQQQNNKRAFGSRF